MTVDPTRPQATLDQLSSAKQRLALLLAARDGGTDGHAPSRRSQPSPRSSDAPVPATPLQGRMWQVEQREGPQPAHAGMCALALSGRLDVGRLAAALQAVLDRHEALRTTVRRQDGPLVQAVAERATLRLDLREPAPAATEQAVLDEAFRELAVGLRLDTGTTMRFRLIRRGTERHLLVLASHLAVFDGWSSAVFVRDLATAYRGEPLARPSLQAPDVAAWQHTWLASPAGQAAVDRLARCVDGIDPPSGRPTAFTRGHVRISLDERVTGPAFAFGATQGATPFMTLLAAAGVALARRSGSERVVVAVPAAGRDVAGGEDAIGQFTTAVPVQVDVTHRPSFRTMLARVRQAARESLAEQRVPIDVLLERFAEGGTPTPPWSTLFALHNYPAGTLELDGVEVAMLPGPPAHHLELYSPRPAAVTAMFGLVESAGRVTGTAEHNRHALDADAVTGLMAETAALLTAAVTDPDATL